MVLAAVMAMSLEPLPQGSRSRSQRCPHVAILSSEPASSLWALHPDLFGRWLAGSATDVLNLSRTVAGIGEPLIGRSRTTR
jgi:OPA family glycerol-3-phosphate transporter-like MFS transporter/OPA family sugar phosphate sensor protein UhpC-like MFS transporter